MGHIFTAITNHIKGTLFKGSFSVQKKGQRSQCRVAVPENWLGKCREVSSSKFGSGSFPSICSPFLYEMTWYSSTSWWFIVNKGYLYEIFLEEWQDYVMASQEAQLSIATPLPPIKGRNKKIKPHLTVYSTKTNLTPGLAKIYSARGKGAKNQKGKGGKRFIKCGQAGEENSSHGMSFLPPQTLFMKSELLHPWHMEPEYRTDGKWENFKPFPDFSSVFSPFTSWAPDGTGANNVSLTLCPHSPVPVPGSSEGLHAGRDL